MPILLQASLVALGLLSSPQAASVPAGEPTAVVQGRVTDPYGQPLPGAVVTFVPHKSAVATWTSSVADGSYLLRNVPAGAGILRFEREGYVREELSVRVVAGEDVSRHDVSLFLGRLEGESAWDLRGRVVDAKRRGLAEVSVWVDAIGSTTQVRRDVRTAADGSFEVTLRYPGDYVVCARVADRLPACAAVRVPFADTVPQVTVVLGRAAAGGQ